MNLEKMDLPAVCILLFTQDKRSLEDHTRVLPFTGMDLMLTLNNLFPYLLMDLKGKLRTL